MKKFGFLLPLFLVVGLVFAGRSFIGNAAAAGGAGTPSASTTPTGVVGLPGTGGYTAITAGRMVVFENLLVLNQNGQVIGTMKDTVLNLCTGQVEYLVVSTNNNGSEVLVPWQDVSVRTHGTLNISAAATPSAAGLSGTGTPAALSGPTETATPTATNVTTGTAIPTATNVATETATPTATNVTTGTATPAASNAINNLDVSRFGAGVVVLKVSQQKLNSAPTFQTGAIPNVDIPGWDNQIRSYWGMGPATTNTNCRIGATNTGAVVSGTPTAYGTPAAGTPVAGLPATGAGVTGTPTVGMTATVTPLAPSATPTATASLPATGASTTGTPTAGMTASGTPAAAMGTPAATPGLPNTGPAANTIRPDVVILGSNLMGAPVMSSNGNYLGDIVDMIINTDTGNIQYLTVSAAGSLGIGFAYFPVPVSLFDLYGNASQYSSGRALDYRPVLVLGEKTDTFLKAPLFRAGGLPDTAVSGWDNQVKSFWNQYVK